jgi:hypothetical protein
MDGQEQSPGGSEVWFGDVGMPCFFLFVTSNFKIEQVCTSDANKLGIQRRFKEVDFDALKQLGAKPDVQADTIRRWEDIRFDAEAEGEPRREARKEFMDQATSPIEVPLREDAGTDVIEFDEEEAPRYRFNEEQDVLDEIDAWMDRTTSSDDDEEAVHNIDWRQ